MSESERTELEREHGVQTLLEIFENDPVMTMKIKIFATSMSISLGKYIFYTRNPASYQEVSKSFGRIVYKYSITIIRKSLFLH